MNEVKRVCPACGAGNDLERDTCYACGAGFNLPVPAGGRLPATWKQVGTSLAVGAAALVIKFGLQLLNDYLEQRTAQSAKQPAQTQIPVMARTRARKRQHPQAPVTPRQRARVRVWGRRAWGMRRSDGSGGVEVEEFYWQADSR